PRGIHGGRGGRDRGLRARDGEVAPAPRAPAPAPSPRRICEVAMTHDPDEREKEINRALDAALEAHVPQHRPSAAFARRLRERLVAAQGAVSAAPAPARAARAFPWRAALPAFAAGLALALLVPRAIDRHPRRAPERAAEWSLVDE